MTPELYSLAANITSDKAYDKLQVYVYEQLDESESPRQTAKRIFKCFNVLAESFAGDSKILKNEVNVDSDDDGIDPDLK